MSAHSVEEAKTIGTGYAERFVAGLFYQAGRRFPGWLQAGYAHWLEPEAQVDTAAAGDLPGVRPPFPLLIETPRLRLRELRPTDFDSVHEYANDPDVIRLCWAVASQERPGERDMRRRRLERCSTTGSVRWA